MMNLGEALSSEEIQVKVSFLKDAGNASFLCFQSMIDEADQDGDGQINYEEFYQMMQSI